MKSVPDEKPDRAAGLSFPVAKLSGIQGVTVTRLCYVKSIKRQMALERFRAIFIPIGTT